MPHSLVVHAIPWIESWSRKIGQSRRLEQIDIVHDPDELFVDLRATNAVHDLVLRVTERASSNRLANPPEWRDVDEVTCVPRRSRSDDGDLRLAFEVPFNRTDRQLKLKSVVWSGDVEPNELGHFNPCFCT